MHFFEFFSVSRSCVINLKYYKKTNGKQALLRGGIFVPVSRRYLPLLEKRHDAYMTQLLRYR